MLLKIHVSLQKQTVVPNITHAYVHCLFSTLWMNIYLFMATLEPDSNFSHIFKQITTLFLFILGIFPELKHSTSSANLKIISKVLKHSTNAHILRIILFVDCTSTSNSHPILFVTVKSKT